MKSKIFNYIKFVLSLSVLWGIMVACEPEKVNDRDERLRKLDAIFAADFPLMEISSGEMSNTIRSTKYFLRVDYPHYEHNSNVNYLRSIAMRWKRSDTENMVHVWSIERINWVMDSSYSIPKVRFNIDTGYLFKDGPRSEKDISDYEKKLDKFLASYSYNITIYCTRDTYAQIMQ